MIGRVRTKVNGILIEELLESKFSNESDGLKHDKREITQKIWVEDGEECTSNIQ